jgi:hypothetical protein
LVIPGEFYKGGVSLSPRPVEGEEEEKRKGIVRRWMVACKVSEYVFSPRSEGRGIVANDIVLRQNIDMMWRCCI